MSNLIINNIDIHKIKIHNLKIKYVLPYTTIIGLPILLRDFTFKDGENFSIELKGNSLDTLQHIDDYLNSNFSKYSSLLQDNKIIFNYSYKLKTIYHKHNKDKLLISINRIHKDSNNTYKPIIYIYE